MKLMLGQCDRRTDGIRGTVDPNRRFGSLQLAASIGVALAIVPLTGLTAPAVTNCSDSGSGSLRNSLAAAGEGDTIDLTKLSCSKITLGSALTTARNNLTITGKSAQALTISGNNQNFGVLEHSGTGTLTINNLSMTDANYTSGGCIVSLGSVALNGVTMSYCTSTGIGGKSLGGAVGVVQDVTITNSTLNKNYASDSTYPGALAFGGAVFGVNITISKSTISSNSASTGGNNVGGGGVYALGTLTISDTTLRNNTAIDVGGANAAGGGAFAGGAVTITGSTFADNASTVGAGLAQGSTGKIVTVTNSTLSGNTGFIGGGMAIAGTFHLNNSTVALNYVGGTYGAAGIEIASAAVFQSSIVAKNSAPKNAAAADVASKGVAVSITGSNNLVMASPASVTLPAGTLKTDPKLASFLENNGGPTQTLALQAGSPAIAAGNNLLRLPYDQRGTGFARMTREKTDIGAYQSGDGIFANGFE